MLLVLNLSFPDGEYLGTVKIPIFEHIDCPTLFRYVRRVQDNIFHPLNVFMYISNQIEPFRCDSEVSSWLALHSRLLSFGRFHEYCSTNVFQCPEGVIQRPRKRYLKK